MVYRKSAPRLEGNPAFLKCMVQVLPVVLTCMAHVLAVVLRFMAYVLIEVLLDSGAEWPSG